MFRSVSTTRGPGKYEKLDEEASGNGHGGHMNNIEELEMTSSSTFNHSTLQRNPTKKVSKEKKSHPIFSLFDFRRKKKTTSRPEFTRYHEYVKEGGMWDLDANKPVIYYK
ncbi:hypothetical protein G2W53_036454 [Senna tora]|uniref:Uncharacterized protein n=1 Tax=Senna tora TaxID=362788 RepID=A0A834SU06_9FABA|nr:hypothetical protein G2W53_036454 [Senna tora]